MFQSKWSKRQKQLCVSREAGGVVAERFEIDMSEVPGIVDGSIVELAGLPEHHTILDWILDNDDIDTGTPAIVFDIGIMSGDFGDPDPTDARTCGAELFSASTVMQGAAVTRGALATGFRIAPTEAKRGIGIKFTTAPATQGVVGEKIALILFMKQ